MLLLQLAIYYGKASLTAMIVSMNPIFVSIFAIFILKEQVSKIQVYGFLIGFAGIIVLVLGEKELFLHNFINLPLGVLFALLAGITFGLYTVLTKWAVAQYGNLITNSFAFLIGGVVLSIINLIIGQSMAFALSFKTNILIVYLGVVVSGLAYVLYFEAMKELSAARASFYFFLKPALASILAFYFLSENLSHWQIIGMILIMLALSRRVWIYWILQRERDKS